MFKLITGLLILTGLFIGLTGPAAAAPPPQKPSNQQLIDQIKQSTQDRVRIVYHAETGQVSFIGTDPAHTIAQPSVLPADARPEAAARGFLAQYGQLFGLQNPAGDLSVMKEKTLGDGRAFVRFQQRYQGVPVFGGELIVQTDARQDILSVNGETLPDLTLDTRPTVPAEAARQAALVKIAGDYHLAVDQLKASEPELWIYNPALLGSPGPRVSMLVWRTEVTPTELFPLRELVLIDAHLGVVVLNFNQIDTALNRRTYDANNTKTLPGTLRCNEANPTCSGGDPHEVAAHKYAADTYNFYFNNHSRDSIDDAGLILDSTVHFDSGYGNAFWDGNQMVYGDFYGFPLADDVVGHELTHGVTQYESGLIYFYESGAINESLSDVWGEFVDLTNGAGTDTSGVRWLVGEDVSGWPAAAFRDMKNPPAFNDPDKMSSSLYSHGPDDNGGVHTNSGVNNKAAYLMTDGGTFNGITVTAVGLAKVAKIYYEAQTNLLTSASNYTDLGNGLYQACVNLIGQAGITSSDCLEVRDAATAVEMIPFIPGSNTLYLPLVVKNLTSGKSLVNGNFESGRTAWTEFSSQGFTLIRSGSNLPVTPHSGNWAVWLGGAVNEISYIQQQVAVPVGAPYLAYWHWIASQDFCGYDFGGVIINSSNVVNVYDLCSSQNTGGWVKHVVNLSAYAGQTVLLQIRAETDASLNSSLFIDDVAFQATPTVLETTGPDSPTLLEADAALKTNENSSAGLVEETIGEFLLRPANWKPEK
ncbi:MAG: M4 family metallopeptidase [Anaerolineales bacterium]|nr:M4 family metallopeptidase [Anaerolineales bacterium]